MPLQVEVVLYVNYVSRREAEMRGMGQIMPMSLRKAPTVVTDRLCHLPLAGGGGGILNACFSFFC